MKRNPQSQLSFIACQNVITFKPNNSGMVEFHSSFTGHANKHAKTVSIIATKTTAPIICKNLFMFAFTF